MNLMWEIGSGKVKSFSKKNPAVAGFAPEGGLSEDIRVINPGRASDYSNVPERIRKTLCQPLQIGKFSVSVQTGWII